MPTTLWPSLMISAKPWAMPNVPSVATNGGMSRDATSQPLTVPNAAPARIAAPRPSNIDPVASETMATTRDVNVRTAPIDRSSPSVMMISVIGSASIVRTVDRTRTLVMLAGDRNPGATLANTATSSTSVTATPGTRCSGLPGRDAIASRLMHPQSHYVFFRQFRARQMPRDPAFPHYIGAVADVADFRLLR